VLWNASVQATSFEVWRSTSSSSTSAAKIGTPTTTTYDDTRATPGTTYYYWVKAKNSQGTSGFSSADTGYRPLAPAYPTGVIATDGTCTGAVRVTWNAVSGASAYEVWRGTDSSTAGAEMRGGTTATTYDDTSAHPGTTYYYWIKARNAAGTSGFSTPNSGYR
jgi:fibronectin type 3 domain-containing protein